MAGPTGTRALAGLGQRLRAVREAAGMSGLELARALGPGWRQPKILQLETGAKLPTQAEIEEWADKTGADPAPLLALREKAAAEYGPWRDRIAGAGGPAAFQDELGALERSCTVLLAEYQPALVPGLLQTAAYMQGMSEREEFLDQYGITPGNIGQLIAAKIRRQAILYEGGREIVHIMGEAALRTRIGQISVQTMRGQLARTWLRLPRCPGTCSESSRSRSPPPSHRHPASSCTTTTSRSSKPSAAASTPPTPSWSPATADGWSSCARRRSREQRRLRCAAGFLTRRLAKTSRGGWLAERAGRLRQPAAGEQAGECLPFPSA